MKKLVQKVDFTEGMRKAIAEDAKHWMHDYEEDHPGERFTGKGGLDPPPFQVDQPTWREFMMAKTGTLNMRDNNHGTVDMPWRGPSPEALQLGMTVLKPLPAGRMVLVGFGNENSVFDQMPVHRLVFGATPTLVTQAFSEADFRGLAGFVGVRVLRAIVSYDWVLVGGRDSGIEDVSFIDDERHVSQVAGEGGEGQSKSEGEQKSGQAPEKGVEEQNKKGQSQRQNVTASDIANPANKTSIEGNVNIEGEIKQEVTVENDNATLSQAGEQKNEVPSTKLKKRTEGEESGENDEEENAEEENTEEENAEEENSEEEEPGNNALLDMFGLLDSTLIEPVKE